MTLTLGASGWTYRSTFVLYDHQTGSMWLPRPGEDGTLRFTGISGEHAGRVLAPVPLVRTTWRDWVAMHPAATIMVAR